MENIGANLLDEFPAPVAVRRRSLLPWWIKTCCWIFMFMGALGVPAVLIMGIMRMSAQMAFYGLEATDPFTAIGMVLVVIIALKAAAAFGLWAEKDWAIQVATVDAILGIAACVFVMFFMNLLKAGRFGIDFKLELIFLIPYLIKILRLKTRWKEAVAA